MDDRKDAGFEMAMHIERERVLDAGHYVRTATRQAALDHAPIRVKKLPVPRAAIKSENDSQNP